MSTATGRTDRRRRILNEGARVDSTTEDAATGAPRSVRRYAPDASSASFAIARRLLPHRRLAIFGFAVASLAGIAAIVSADLYRAPIAAAIGVTDVPALDLQSPQALARWAQSVGLIGLAGLSIVVFGMRRHRSDDVRGRYRWWLAAAGVSAAASIAVSTSLLTTVADGLTAATGWSLLPAGAIWWLAPSAVIGGLVGLRLILDLKHSAPSLLFALTTVAAAGVAVFANVFGMPGELAPWTTATAAGAGLLANTTAWLTVLVYCRRIVREADGLIDAPARPTATTDGEHENKETTTKSRTKAPNKPAAKPAVAKPTVARQSRPTKPKLAATTEDESPQPAKPARRAAKPQQAATSATQWTDGSDGDDDYGDDQGGRRKLSKAERKRLRKLKARQQRAA